MRRRNLVAFALLGGTALAGCSSSTPPEPSASDAVIIDATTCEAFGDVLTITFNADIARDEGRMQQQEHAGWHRLATRVLHRLPTTGDGAVSDAIAALRGAAPPIALGASGAARVGSDAWNEAFSALMTACEDAGSALASEGFTGG
ncbi:hypothetical protein [Microbacterium sp.]|uniref:hypothetical protein n=1 Tax=Microbacterium sp. TaxID=51671 RepID=UPI00281112D3|nr:hypothetical protein [Microbacterium sp.]